MRIKIGPAEVEMPNWLAALVLLGTIGLSSQRRLVKMGVLPTPFKNDNPDND